MKLKNNFFTLSLLLSIPSYVGAESQNLKSKVLQDVDGTFINAETIAMIKKYQFDALAILYGKRQPDGNRVGTYRYRDMQYSLTELCELEANGEINSEEKKRFIAQIIDDYARISLQFQAIARKVKPIMAELIFESTRRRKRFDSLLNKWAAPKKNLDERILLDAHIKTIQDFEIFLVDLHYFLSDLVASCPKGQELYNQWKAEQLRKTRTA